MKLRAGFLAAATALVAATWLLNRVLEAQRVPAWWTWFVLGFALALWQYWE